MSGAAVVQRRDGSGFERGNSLLVGLDAGGGIGDDGIDLPDTGTRQLELGIADPKRALGGDEGLLILQAGRTLIGHVGAVAADVGNRNRERLILEILAGPGALILGWIDFGEFVSRRDDALRSSCRVAGLQDAHDVYHWKTSVRRGGARRRKPP